MEVVINQIFLHVYTMEGQQVSDSVFDDTSTQAGQSSIKDNTTPAPILKEVGFVLCQIDG